MKSILVTGGAGFIGHHLVKELLRRGHYVVVVDDLSTGKIENLIHIDSKYNDDYKFINLDVNEDYATLDNLFKKHNFDWVFHYAAVVGVKRTLEEPVKVLKDVEGIQNILELCITNPVKKLAFSSSSEVYGDQSGLLLEDGMMNAIQPYAVVKLFGEKYLEAHWQEFNFPTVNFRFFNVYGPGQDSSDYGFVTGRFIELALQDLPIPIYGDGSATRDFVYIDDNIQATINLMDDPRSNGETYNITHGANTSILELAENIIELTNSKSEIMFLPKRDDILHRHGSGEKLSKNGFKFTTSLDDGLLKTIEYYEKHLNVEVTK